MKNKYTIVALCFLLGLSTYSCKDFLEEDPKGQMTTKTFFSNKSDMDMALHSVYYHVAEHSWINSHLVYAWKGDDIGTHQAFGKESVREFDTYNVSGSNVWMAETWKSLWTVVRVSNYFINNAGRTPDVSEQEKKEAIAQAHYWRAYAYFFLVQTWGEIPIILADELNYTAEREPINKVYDLIVADLIEAENVKINYTAAPYVLNGVNVSVNRAAVQATLAYVYLTMAGPWLDRGAEYYTLAAEKAKQVIDGVNNGTYTYRLLDEYKQVHSIEWNNKNPELLLGVYYTLSLGRNNVFANLSGVADVNVEAGANGWSDSCGEIWFWQNFPNGPRKDATYAPKTLRPGDNTLQDWWWDTSPSTRQMVNPWFIKSAEGNSGQEWDYQLGGNQGDYYGQKNHQIIRLSEVYCWYAEAIGRAGRNDDDAYTALNKVRLRADLGEIPAGSLSPEGLAEAAYNEHGWEIAGWYWSNIAPRYFDMFRMNRVKDHFEFRKQNPMIEVAPGVFRKEAVQVTGSWNNDMMYAPYPAVDVLINPNLNK